MYWNGNNLYVWEILQKLPVGDSEWIKNTPQFNADFTKNYNKESNKVCFLEVDVQYSK